MVPCQTTREVNHQVNHHTDRTQLIWHATRLTGIYVTFSRFRYTRTGCPLFKWGQEGQFRRVSNEISDVHTTATRDTPRRHLRGPPTPRTNHKNRFPTAISPKTAVSDREKPNDIHDTYPIAYNRGTQQSRPPCRQTTQLSRDKVVTKHARRISKIP